MSKFLANAIVISFFLIFIFGATWFITQDDSKVALVVSIILAIATVVMALTIHQLDLTLQQMNLTTLNTVNEYMNGELKKSLRVP
ncbi:MAG: hypothetical protein IMW86_04220 [Hydrogenibacillus sp.]|nr:hypothetical protein [Hydrogenibacillus sp.]